MDGQYSMIMSFLGTMGLYMTMMMVLALAVETILNSVKASAWLNEKARSAEWLSFLDVQKDRVSPDQLMRDIAYWVPPRSQAEMQAAMLNNLTVLFPTVVDEGTKIADAGFKGMQELVALTGLDRQTATARQRLAEKMYVYREQFDKSERERIARLRRVSALLGMFIAFFLGLDTFEMLSALFPAGSEPWLSNIFMSTSGKMLTGIAASAGSSFWHDQLDRVRAVKDSVRTMNELRSQVAG